MAHEIVPGFSAALSEVDRRDGHVSFCYPSRTGALQATLRHINTRLETINLLRGKEKTRALADLTDYVAEAHSEINAISAEWTAHIDSLKKPEAA